MTEAEALTTIATAAQPAEYCLLWVNWWATCLTKSEWAGWMQAVGAIVAIVFAYRLGQAQLAMARQLEAERRNASDYRVLGALQLASQEAMDTLRRFLDRLDEMEKGEMVFCAG